MHTLYNKLQIIVCITLLSQLHTARAMDVNDDSINRQECENRIQTRFPRSLSFNAKKIFSEEDENSLSSENEKKLLSMIFYMKKGENYIYNAQSDTWNILRSSSPTIKVNSKK